MRRVRFVIVLIALACALFAGSTGVTDAGVTAGTHALATVKEAGHRW
jgi:hypothetical protein